jgi:4-hydroxybenzoyl-CoA reductase subunit beta
MLRLDPVQVETPASLDAALALLDTHGARAKIVAGGTDALPNMKHGLHEPDVVIHIGRLKTLSGVRDAGDALEIGALTTLHELAHHALVLKHAPGLALAAAAVAGPQLRRMGTLGGNLALDTRCLYYNQSYFWREALGFCLKKDGSVCHVVAGGKKCVAAASNDTATMLLCLDASVELRRASSSRTLKLEDFYVADGAHNTVLDPHELLVSVRVPKGGAHRKEGYAKLRHRNSIDFPLLSVGVRVDVDPTSPTQVRDVRVTVSALQARPQRVALDTFKGRALDATFVQEVAALAQQRATPLTNLADDPAWRKEMVSIITARAFEAAGVRS